MTFTQKAKFSLLKRLAMYRDYLAGLDEKRIVLFLDSFDSIFFGSPQEVLANWRHGLARQNA